MRRVYHKFKAKPVTDDGHRFASKLEWEYFNHLNMLQKAGEVLFSLRQPTFHLPGGVRYAADYQIFTTDGRVRFVDVKGLELETFKIKKRIVESIYPVEIEVVKKEDF